jgi:hypothetical protein
MPKTDMDYNNCMIYKIVCNDLNIKDLYVGHTTNFKQRKAIHKHRCNNPNDKDYSCKVYQTIRNHGGWENWSMILVEYYPCNDDLQARARERFWYEILNCNLNMVCPYKSLEEWLEYHKKYREKNREKILEQKREYREKNREKILEQKKEYREKNREKIAEKDKKYREKNREKIAEKDKKYYEKNREKIKEKMKEYYENNKEQIEEKKKELITCECGRQFQRCEKSRHLKTKIHSNYIQTLNEKDK